MKDGILQDNIARNEENTEKCELLLVNHEGWDNFKGVTN
jgi:hypothetical protein